MAPRFHMDAKSLDKLVQEVKKRECLWNVESEVYNDRFLINSSWVQISEILQVPEHIVRVKWKNLRDFFKKELKKYKLTSPDEYSGTWRYFKAMWFLRKPGSHSREDSENDNDDNYHVEFLEDNSNFIKCESDIEPQYLEEEEVDPIPDGSKKRKNSESKEDFDEMFLKSLTPYFRELDPIRKLVVRSKMQDLLLNEIAAQNSTTKMQLIKNNSKLL